MSSKKAFKHGSSTRLMILVMFLIVVGIGCIFEFTYARPQFQAAWEKIKTVDSSANSGEFTSEMVERLFGGATVEEVLETPRGKDDDAITPKKPSRIDENMHDDCVVRTYRWRSGLLFKSHDIHVVFTKLKKGIEKKNPKLKGRVYYFSAAAGQPLDRVENFPLEKESIVINLNPPQLMGGGIPGGDSNRPKKGKGKKKGSDENKDGKKGEKKKASDKDESTKEEKGASTDEESKTADKSDDNPEKEADDPNQEKEGDVEKSETEEKTDADATKEADESKKSEEAGEKGEGESDKKDG